MSALPRLLVTLLLAAAFASSGIAGGRSHGNTKSSGTVQVSGYYRKNGTYVPSYTRRAPGTATNTTAAESHNSGGTLAEKLAAQNPDTTTAAASKNQTKEEPLPKGLTTAEERAKKLAQEERLAAAQENRYQAHVVGLDSNGNPIIGTNVVRDSHGRIKRSESAKRAFMRTTGYPNGRPGYVVDHIIPLSKGGSDDPSNMQWQTTEEATAKDKWERK